MKRKSPYKHPVRAHIRNKRPVIQYERGKGKQTINPRRRRVVGGLSNPENLYNISIFYFDGLSERLEVDSKSYSSALRTSIEQREEPAPPRIIRMRKG